MSGVGEGGGGAGPRVVLYRCTTPTNWLCPCGDVERRLTKLGIEHRTVRLPRRRSERPEIEELTGQRRLPVLVDGDEVIHDSKRILEYLDWRQRHGRADEGDLYNVKHGDPEHSDYADRQGRREDQRADRGKR